MKVRPPRRRVPHAIPRVFHRSWVAIIAIALMVASEYRFSGSRSQRAALSGDADARAAIEVAIYVLAAMFLALSVARPPGRRRLPRLVMAVWGFTLAMVLVSFWSPFPELAVTRAGQLVIVAWFGHLVARHATSTQLWWLVHGYLLVMAVSVVGGLVSPFSPSADEEGRFTYFGVHPNICGAFLGMATLLALVCFLRRREQFALTPWSTEIYGFFLALMVGGLLATRSRGALAGAVAAIFLMLWSRSRRRSRLDLAIIGMSVFGAVSLLAGGDIIVFLERGESTEQLGSLNSRTSVWTESWSLFLERPFFGHGFMSARGAFLERFGLGGAHNALVEVLFNSGIFGSFFWLLLLVLVVRAAHRLGADRHPDGPLLLGMIGGLIVNALTDGGLGQSSSLQIIWLVIIVGWLVTAARESESVEQRSPARSERPSAAPDPAARALPLAPTTGHRPAPSGDRPTGFV